MLVEKKSGKNVYHVDRDEKWEECLHIELVISKTCNTKAVLFES